MNRIVKYFFSFICITPFCCGCSSLKYVEFDVVRPPRILLPDSTSVAVIMNISDADSVVKNLPGMSGDTLTNIFYNMIVTGLNSSGYVCDVETYNITNPTGKPLEAEEFEALSDTLSGRAIITLNSLAITHENDVDTIDSGWHISTLRYIARTNISVAASENMLPVLFTCIDTTEWQGSGYTKENAKESFPTTDNCILETLAKLQSMVETQYIPYKDKVGRIYFVSLYPLMRDADKYWQAGKYVEASYLWEYVYENTSRRNLQAQAAANMAIYEELNDRYEESLMWARISLSLYSKHCNLYDSQIAYLSDYIRQLKDREKEKNFFIKNNLYHF